MKRSLGEKTFNVVNILLVTVLCVIMIYPYLNQLAISFNQGMDSMLGGITIFPRKFTWENYRTVFTNVNFFNAVLVSVTRVIISVVLSILVVFSAAYGLTRKNLAYRRGITLYLMIPAYISAGVIPVYMLYRYIGLINNYMVYIVPALFSFYNMIIIRSFLQELPRAIEESATIDGANDFQIMIQIAFPISLPVIATVALWVAVAAWNDWTTTLMYVTKKGLYTLQYLMMKLIKESEVAQQMASQSAMSKTQRTLMPTSESVKSATLIVTTLPIILVYPFLQKYFISGVTLGAVKE